LQEGRRGASRGRGYIGRLEQEAGFRGIGDREHLAELVLDMLNGVAWSWLSHRDSDRALASLDHFASLLATLVTPSAG
jgi:hypothetical protein